MIKIKTDIIKMNSINSAAYMNTSTNKDTQKGLFGFNAITRAMSFGLIMALSSALVMPIVANASEGHDHTQELPAKSEVIEDDGHGHGHGAVAETEEKHGLDALTLTAEQRELAAIKVVNLTEQNFS